MPPAFNLSQDQTLQFKPSPIAEATDFFLAQQTLRHRSACRYLFGIIQTTPEHPHKLSDDPIVKDLNFTLDVAELPLRQDRQFYRTRGTCQPLICAPSPLSSPPCAAPPGPLHFRFPLSEPRILYDPERLSRPFRLVRRPAAHQPALSRIRAMRRLPTW